MYVCMYEEMKNYVCKNCKKPKRIDCKVTVRGPRESHSEGLIEDDATRNCPKFHGTLHYKSLADFAVYDR